MDSLHPDHQVSSEASKLPKRQPTGFSIADALSVEEHGRTFNAYREGKYLLPNDGDEQDRLDLQHHTFKVMLRGRLFLAPIDNPSHVLDIGTGTGIWAKEFARQHPTSNVIGTDISVIQTQTNNPANLSFVREDSEGDEWIFDHLFDYIYWRMMCSCFHNYPAMLTRIYNNLRPGGYAEFLDYAFEFVGADAAAETFYQASSFARFIRCIVAGGATHGKDFHSGRKLKDWMIEAGFENVVEQQFPVPLNQWPLDPMDKILGGWSSLNWLKFLGGTTKLLAAGGVPLEEIPTLLEEVREDITNANMRIYWIMYGVYGQKPEVPHSHDTKRTSAK